MKHLILSITALLLSACTSNPSSDALIDNGFSSSTSSSTSLVNIQEQPMANISSAPEYAEKTDAEWKKILTPDQYHILREAGTETPFTSPLLDEHRKGTFVSADCGEPLFRSETKYDSGTGWPSFYAPISPDAVIEKTDTTLGMERTEVLSQCGGHLGHVFDDGPQPTGLRYCMNGIALKFIPDAEQ